MSDCYCGVLVLNALVVNDGTSKNEAMRRSFMNDSCNTVYEKYAIAVEQCKEIMTL